MSSQERDEQIVSKANELSEELRSIRAVMGSLSELNDLGVPPGALRPVVEHLRERHQAVEAGVRELREQEDDPELMAILDGTAATMTMAGSVLDSMLLWEEDTH